MNAMVVSALSPAPFGIVHWLIRLQGYDVLHHRAISNRYRIVHSLLHFHNAHAHRTAFLVHHLHRLHTHKALTWRAIPSFAVRSRQMGYANQHHSPLLLIGSLDVHVLSGGAQPWCCRHELVGAGVLCSHHVIGHLLYRVRTAILCWTCCPRSEGCLSVFGNV